MESANSTVLKKFIDYLCGLEKQHAWWYELQYPPSSPHSLARLCGLETPDLGYFLSAIGWSKPHGEKQRVNRKQIEFFVFSRPEWHGFLEFNFRKVAGKSSFWIRVGRYYEEAPFTPEDQLQKVKERSQRPPNINRVGRRKFQDSYCTWLQQTTMALQEKLEKQMLERLAEETYLIPLELLSDPSIINDTVTPPCLPINVAVSLEEPAELTNAPSLREHHSPSVGEGTQQSVVSPETSKKKAAFEHAVRGVQQYSVNPNNYKVLQKYNIDPRDGFAVESILRDLVKLRQDVKDHDVFSFVAFNDVQSHLVQIPSSRNRLQFQKNVTRQGYNWVNHVLDAVVPASNIVAEAEENEETSILDNETGTERKDAALWLISHLGYCYADEFVKAASQLGIPIHSETMDFAQTAEMWDTGGVGTTGQAIIRNRFKQHYGWNFCASKKEMKPLSAAVISPETR